VINSDDIKDALCLVMAGHETANMTTALIINQSISTFVRRRYNNILSSASFVVAHRNNQVLIPLANSPRLMFMSRRLEGKLFKTVGAVEQKSETLINLINLMICLL